MSDFLIALRDAEVMREFLIGIEDNILYEQMINPTKLDLPQRVKKFRFLGAQKYFYKLIPFFDTFAL